MSELDDAAAVLIRTAPTFESHWRTQVAEEPELGELPYTAVGRLAKHIVDDLRLDPAARLETTFETVETLITTGGPKCRNLLIVGFLEDLQNASLYAEVPLDFWKHWLGRETADAWSWLIEVWEGRMSPADFNARVDCAGPNHRPS